MFYGRPLAVLFFPFLSLPFSSLPFPSLPFPPLPSSFLPTFFTRASPTSLEGAKPHWVAFDLGLGHQPGPEQPRAGRAGTATFFLSLGPCRARDATFFSTFFPRGLTTGSGHHLFSSMCLGSVLGWFGVFLKPVKKLKSRFKHISRDP